MVLLASRQRASAAIANSFTSAKIPELLQVRQLRLSGELNFTVLRGCI